MTSDLTWSLLAAAATTAAILGPATFFAWLARRWRRMDRERKRSPLSQHMLRSAGQTLREQIEQSRAEMAFDLAILAFSPALPLAFFFVYSLVLGRQVSIWVLLVTMIAVGVIVAARMRRLAADISLLDRRRMGLDAEMAVGEELNQLLRQGAYVFHDVPGEQFNVDHVVVAREGVFAVESKGYAKPIRGMGRADAMLEYDGRALNLPTWSSTKPVDQAERQAAWLGRWLTSATGNPVEVLPVLALPGWFVKRTGNGRVRVYSGKELAALLQARGSTPLPPEHCRQVCYQLEQRCRTVQPIYGRIDEND